MVFSAFLMKMELLFSSDELEDSNGTELTLLFDFVLMLQDINQFPNFSQT